MIIYYTKDVPLKESLRLLKEATLHESRYHSYDSTCGPFREDAYTILYKTITRPVSVSEESFRDITKKCTVINVGKSDDYIGEISNVV